MLIVAEKYKMANVIAKVLGYEFAYPFFQNAHGDVVAFAQGHFFEVGLADEASYAWTDPHAFNYLPRQLLMIPSHSDRTTHIRGEQLTIGELREAVMEQMRTHDVIVNACDNDREGERIFFDLFNAAETTARIYRLDLTRGLTRSLITDAFSNLLDGTQTKPAYYASQARNYGDFAFALLTRVMTYYGRKGLLHHLLAGFNDPVKSVVSVGRILAPLLLLIARQCKLVEAVKCRQVSLPAFTGTIADVRGTLEFRYDYAHHGYDASLLSDRRLSERYIASKSAPCEFVISEVIREHYLEGAPSLFDTPSLQAAMSDMSPQDTMDVLQSLYEKGLITYPRTDDDRLPDDDYDPNNLNGLFDSLASNFEHVDGRIPKNATGFLKKQSAIAKALPDSAPKSSGAKGAAHTGLKPTSANVDINRLNDAELRVYTAICERYTQSLLPERSVANVTVRGHFVDESSGVLGEAHSIFVLSKVVPTKKDGASNNKFYGLSEGDVITATEFTLSEHSLDVPQYYAISEIPLVLKNIYKLVDDPDTRELLRRSNGLGTAATRHTFVDSLLSRNYVELVVRDGKQVVVVTSKGLALLSLLPKDMISPATTALWERKFIDIEQASSLSEARQLRDEFVKHIYSSIEHFIRIVNRKYGSGVSGHSANQQPDERLIGLVKQRARALELSVPPKVLSSRHAALQWLDANPIVLHSQQRDLLESSGLDVTDDVIRDGRRLALRQQDAHHGTEHPPSAKNLNKARYWADRVGRKVPLKATKSAYQCSQFIAQCIADRLPSDEQINELKRLVALAKVQLPAGTYDSRKATSKMIVRLRRRLNQH